MEDQRKELADKLDRDLDEWLATREAKPYNEGWDSNNLEKVSFNEYQEYHIHSMILLLLCVKF